MLKWSKLGWTVRELSEISQSSTGSQQRTTRNNDSRTRNRTAEDGFHSEGHASSEDRPATAEWGTHRAVRVRSDCYVLRPSRVPTDHSSLSTQKHREVTERSVLQTWPCCCTPWSLQSWNSVRQLHDSFGDPWLHLGTCWKHVSRGTGNDVGGTVRDRPSEQEPVPVENRTAFWNYHCWSRRNKNATLLSVRRDSLVGFSDGIDGIGRQDSMQQMDIFESDGDRKIRVFTKRNDQCEGKGRRGDVLSDKEFEEKHLGNHWSRKRWVRNRVSMYVIWMFQMSMWTASRATRNWKPQLKTRRRSNRKQNQREITPLLKLALSLETTIHQFNLTEKKTKKIHQTK